MSYKSLAFDASKVILKKASISSNFKIVTALNVVT